MRRARIILLALAALLPASRAASASLTLCNRTSYILYAATGETRDASIVARGWDRLIPGDCAAVIPSLTEGAELFAYARSSDAHSGARRAWGGKTALCVAYGDFNLTSAPGMQCATQGTYSAAFSSVGDNGSGDRTLTFSEPGPVPSPEAARTAGLARLLRDIGYDVGKSGAALDTQRDSALAQFRLRARLSKTAAPSVLFTALEAQARKVAAPFGYSICNDGTSDVWAALGLKDGGDFVSRGWWDVPAGACAPAIATRLGRDPIYLFASREGNNHVVSGPEAFCVANSLFDVAGRSHCAARNLIVAGFLPTNVAGLPGFVAHIGNKGLIFSSGADK
jgi:uncharacterized membrane protein